MKFEDQTFEDAQITLDYNEFIRCKFVRCTMHFAGGQYQFTGCSLDTVRFAFHDAADRTLTYVKMIYSMQNGPELVRELLESASAPKPMKLN